MGAPRPARAVVMRLGAAAREFTPPAGTRFGGFWDERPTPAVGAHDPLLAQALVIDDGHGGAAALVALDLQLVSRPAVDEVRRRVTAATDIAGEAVLVHATHDHSAPGGHWSEAYVEGAGDWFAESEVAERIVAAATDAVVAAWQARAPGRMHAAAGDIAGIGRLRDAPQRPERAPATVVRVVDAVGATRIAVAAYGCHASVLGPDNLLFSADYVGVVRDRLRQAFGADQALFFNAPAADLSTRHTRRAQTFDEVERLGGRLALELAALGEGARPLPSGTVRGRLGEVPLTLGAAAPPPAGAYARLRARLRVDRVACAVQALRAGGLVVVGVEAEVGYDLGLALLARARASAGADGAALVVAPAGGSVGNVPSPLFAPGAGAELLAGVEATLAALDASG